MAEENEGLPIGSVPPPTADEPDKDARMWAMFCHLSGLAVFTSVPFANVIAPLIIWQVKKDEHPYVDRHGKEALNFQISMAIYGLVVFISGFATCGLTWLAGLPLLLADLVVIIIAGVKANNNEPFEYPLCIRFFK